MPLHIGKGRDISTAIADIVDYVKNPQKTDRGKFIYGYECDTRIADAEFLLSKRQYMNLTGRSRGEDDVIAYHLRALCIQCYGETRSRHQRWRSLGVGEISPTSIPEDFPETGNPLELASLRKDALLARFVPNSG